MMQTSLMGSKDVIDLLLPKNKPIPKNEPSQKIIPLAGAIGTFDYNIVKDEVTCDEINRLVVGLDSNIYKFADILEKVESKTRFQEQTIGYSGDEKIVYSSPISLVNGNVITAKYNMIYDQNDPDVLIGMTGESQLITVAWIF